MYTISYRLLNLRKWKLEVKKYTFPLILSNSWFPESVLIQYFIQIKHGKIIMHSEETEESEIWFS